MLTLGVACARVQPLTTLGMLFRGPGFTGRLRVRSGRFSLLTTSRKNGSQNYAEELKDTT